MKRKHSFLPWFLLAIFLFALSKAPGQSAGTAWQALDAVKSQRGALAVGNVTQMRGHLGQDQPVAWEIVTRAADGERVYVVQGGKIIADTVYSSGSGVPIDMRRLRVDSGEAFVIANRAATNSKVSFDSLDYALRSSTTGNAPLWVIHLRDGAGQDVGEIEVSGEDGSLLRKSWFEPRVAKRTPIGPEPSARRARRSYAGGGAGGAAAPSTGAGILQRTTTGVDGAADRMKNGFQNIGDGIRGIFKGDATYEVRDEPRINKPKTLRRGSR